MTERNLLIRPVKHPLERIDDYLARLATANGFSSATTLRMYLRAWCNANGHSIRRIGNADTMARALSRYLDRIVETKSFDRPAFGKANPHLKTCKACLSEQKATPFYWYLDDYQVCHIHVQPLSKPGASEMSLDVDANLTLHPIVDFLESSDPWLAYTNVQKCTDELSWLCWRLKNFYEVHLGSLLHTMNALNWTGSAPPGERSSDGRFDLITSLIAEQSGQRESDLRLLSALLLWQRMVPNNLFGAACAGEDGATEASLEWASRQLIANEPMLMFICDAHHAPRNTPKLRLRDYIPLLAVLDEATDKALRQAVYSCGLTTELLVVIPSGCKKTQFKAAPQPLVTCQQPA
ncbi:TniQ family protein [uncultured Microbulbifer sp.]|uniref:TniQ family protein n=1 Tax=uncultured Microbulbifer sp. TaxID=348147 RepID=UPI0026072E41|nr:TniQ family protein [uncultured Microbulbifer sp.]